MTTTISADKPQAPSPIDSQALDALINNALLGAYDLDMSAGQAFRSQVNMMVNDALAADGMTDTYEVATKVYEFDAFDLGIEIARLIMTAPLGDHRAAMRDLLQTAIEDARKLTVAELEARK